MDTKAHSLISAINDMQDIKAFRQHHWEGSLAEYLDIVRGNPQVARTAYQRLYDMIMSYGSENYTHFREELTHYRFFDDPVDNGADAVFGLDNHLEDLVQVFQSAARGYGTERRVLLLHGPVGSAKSTIVRLLKKGLEAYSATDEGALYSLVWETRDGRMDCPMHEEPLRLIPPAARKRVLAELDGQNGTGYPIEIEGDLCPACRYVYRTLMDEYSGDWSKVIEHVRVRRLILSEKDRVGIGTFQPKDEKNQDSTELTGDINYRKIAEYGSDSDPRAFNFDGELNIANRGIVEFIELLKLEVAFLYDLLTASQEHKIKPKKFAQTDIDEVIIGHSVAGDTPIPYLADGQLRWATMTELYTAYVATPAALQVMSVNVTTGATEWTPVKALFRHPFSGEVLQTSQKWGVVETTPNHSIYDRNLQPFYPEDCHEVLALRQLPPLPAPLQRFTLEIPGVVDTLDQRIYTAQLQSGWGRIAQPRVATQLRTEYSTQDAQSIKDLLTLIAWYATEGHVNWRNGGVVITQADKTELERVQAAYQRITTAQGSIDFGAKTDSAWRLYLGSTVVQKMLVHCCSQHSAHKRLPDFVFNLPPEYQAHLFDELMRTDGSRALRPSLTGVVSDAYSEQYFDYKTTSSLLAAQVGLLASTLGM
ncbi:MAG: serine/threonine protein kinase, partial [Chloroflexota bacterium]|nr:serine/threonine protein kinase [Chloroflexota bacterium]